MREMRDGTNIEITTKEIAQIRELDDFDLTMFLSELEDHGWLYARKLLVLIVEAAQ